MAFAVTSTLERRIKRYNPFENKVPPDEIYLPWEGQHKAVSCVERPSIQEYTGVSAFLGTIIDLRGLTVKKNTNRKMSLPCPPFVEINGVHNLRDIGGYPTTPGLCVRRNIVYRSGDFKSLTQVGEEKLAAMGFETIFDLRSSSEIARARVNGGETYYDAWTSPVPTRPQREDVPVFSDQDYSPEVTAIRFKDYASEGTEVRRKFPLEK